MYFKGILLKITPVFPLCEHISYFIMYIYHVGPGAFDKLGGLVLKMAREMQADKRATSP